MRDTFAILLSRKSGVSSTGVDCMKNLTTLFLIAWVLSIHITSKAQDPTYKDVIDYGHMNLTTYTFTGCNGHSEYKDPEGYFLYSNNRWTGENGCIWVKHGPPTITFWTSHFGVQTMSEPFVGLGNNWGGLLSKGDLPARIQDIEIFKASMVAKIPNWDGTKLTRVTGGEPNIDLYRIYYQFCLVTDLKQTRPNAGDWNLNVFQTPTCDANWWGKLVGTYKDSLWNYKMTNQGMNGFGDGPFRTAIVDPFPKPDAYGVIRAYNNDIKE